MKESIKRNIERFGSDITLIVKTYGAIDFTTGKPTEIVTRTPMTALIGHYRESEIIKGIVDMNDLKCTLQTDDLVKDKDEVEIGGNVYVVMNTAHLIRNDTVLKTTLQLRQK